MITNERQYRITKAEAERLRKAIAESKASGTKLSPRMRQAVLDGLRSQLDDLCNEMAQYDTLREGHVRELQYDSLADLPNALIAARIAANLTQKELAERLSLKEQQIQHYEANDYRGASLERLVEVAEALGGKFCFTVLLSLGHRMNRQYVLDTLSQQRDEIMQTYGLSRLAIFGSIARDEFSDDSDLDVLIEFKEGEATFEHFMDLKFRLEDFFGVKVDLVTEYSLRPALRRYVEQDAIEIE